MVEESSSTGNKKLSKEERKKEYDREYHRRNKMHFTELHMIWIKKHPNYYKDRRAKNCDEINRKQRQYRIDNHEQLLKYERKYRKKHPEVQRRADKKYYWNHRQIRLNNKKLWTINHPEKARQSRHKQWEKEYDKRVHTEYRVAVIEFLGGKCCMCGYKKDVRGLQLDHINGGGRYIMKMKGGSLKMYKFYHDNPRIAIRDLQVLCACCNQIKKSENNENKWRPHRRICSKKGVVSVLL